MCGILLPPDISVFYHGLFQPCGIVGDRLELQGLLMCFSMLMPAFLTSARAGTRHFERKWHAPRTFWQFNGRGGRRSAYPLYKRMPCGWCANPRSSDAAPCTIDCMSTVSGYVRPFLHLCVQSISSQFETLVDVSANRDSGLRYFLPGISVSSFLAFDEL